MGTAAISLFLGGFDDIPSIVDISGHNAPGVTMGSLEGEGNAPFQPITVFLGANNLTVGSNNLSTTFAGVIQDAACLAAPAAR